MLVTTRLASGWHRHAAVVRLGVLEPADAVKLFKRILGQHGPRDHTGADAVCAELGHLALAVEQAAAYCAETGVSPSATWNDSLPGPRRCTPPPRRAATPPAPAPASGASRSTASTPLRSPAICCACWPGTPPTASRAICSTPRLAPRSRRGDRQARGVQHAHRQPRRHPHGAPPGPGPGPHARPRRPPPAGRRRRPGPGPRYRTPRRAYPAHADAPSNWPRYQGLLPHADALVGHHSSDHDTSDTAYVLDRTASYRQLQGASNLALPAFQRALATCERLLGQDHPNALTSRNNSPTPTGRQAT